MTKAELLTITAGSVIRYKKAHRKNWITKTVSGEIRIIEEGTPLEFVAVPVFLRKGSFSGVNITPINADDLVELVKVGA
jgi:hypothetical protein